MNTKNLNLITNFQQRYFLKKDLNKKKSLVEGLNKDVLKSLKNENNSLHILNNKIELNFKINELRKFKKYQNIVLIGMGGSILGAEAIYQYLYEKIKKKVYFFDNIDEKKIFKFRKEVKLKKTLFLVISKSGNTIETISNLLSLNILKRNEKNIIIITEKKNNVLYNLSKEFDLFYIQHRNSIGGRYSVLSEVGMVPAYLMGLNINLFRKNTQKYLEKKKFKKILNKNVVLLSDFLLKKKYKNIIFLNYAPSLEKFLFWSQQLIAESLGKKGMGFLPIISSAPKDHHSLLQLYLDGPKDKIFYIFSLKNSKTSSTINAKKISSDLKFLHKKSLEKIKNSQKDALIQSLKINKIPFREFKVFNTNESTLGELFSYFILETAMIAKLTGINPFDQPAVEQVKKFTRKILN